MNSVYGSDMRGTRHGSVAIEYALLVPALLLFVLGIMDTGRLLWTYATLNRAVEAAARCGTVNTVSCASAGQIKTYAAGQAYGLSVPSSAFTVTTPACGVSVTATYTFRSVIPWLHPAAPFGQTNTITLNAAACYPKAP